MNDSKFHFENVGVVNGFRVKWLPDDQRTQHCYEALCFPFSVLLPELRAAPRHIRSSGRVRKPLEPRSVWLIGMNIPVRTVVSARRILKGRVLSCRTGRPQQESSHMQVHNSKGVWHLTTCTAFVCHRRTWKGLKETGSFEKKVAYFVHKTSTQCLFLQHMKELCQKQQIWRELHVKCLGFDAELGSKVKHARRLKHSRMFCVPSHVAFFSWACNEHQKSPDESENSDSTLGSGVMGREATHNNKSAQVSKCLRGFYNWQRDALCDETTTPEYRTTWEQGPPSSSQISWISKILFHTSRGKADVVKTVLTVNLINSANHFFLPVSRIVWFRIH